MLDKQRREFIILAGAAGLLVAAKASRARGQQPGMPVVGFLRDSTAAGSEFMVNGLRKGLAEAGFIEGRNVTIEYAWTEGRSERLSALAAELVGRHLPVIVSSALQRDARCQGGDLHDSSCIRGQQRSRGKQAGCEPEPARRQSHRCGLFGLCPWSKTAGAHARDGAKGCRLRRARASDLSGLRAVH
jgi:hypothetical protein